MSVALQLIELSEEQLATVWNLLTFKPKSYRAQLPAIPCYHVEAGTILLPYRFACGLMGREFGAGPESSAHIMIPPAKFECELRDYQAGPAAEAWDLLHKHRTVTIGLPPGWGKTILAIRLANRLGYLTLIIVHQEHIAMQWYRSLNLCVPGLAGTFWLVGYEQPRHVTHVICMATRIEYLDGALRSKVGCLVLDEMHLLCVPKCIRSLLATQPAYTIALSATLERSDGMECIAHAIVGTHGVFRVSTVPYRVYLVPTGCLASEKYGRDGNIDFTELSKSLAADEDRNALIVETIRRLSVEGNKLMCFTRLTGHVETIAEKLAQSGVHCDTLYGGKKTYTDSSVLVGTFPKIGTGFDEAQFCENFGGVTSNLAVFLLSVKKWQMFEQVRGRVMRNKNPGVIWFLDENPLAAKHFAGIQSWIRETNGTVVPWKGYRPNVAAPE